MDGGAWQATYSSWGHKESDTRGRLVGFLQLRRQYQISHEVQRGAPRPSRVVLGTSGLRATEVLDVLRAHIQGGFACHQEH